MDKRVLTVMVVLVLFLSARPLYDRCSGGEVRIDTVTVVRDSIRLRIDTVRQEIERVKVKYVQERDAVVRNTVAEDYEFFTGYLEWNRKRHGGGDNAPPAEGD